MLLNAGDRIADALESVVDRTGRVMAWLVLAVVFFLFVQNPLREYLGRGQFFANDMGQLSHAAVFMIGVAYAWRRDRQARVDLLYRSMSPRAKAFVNLPVAFTLMGTAVGFALVGNALGFFDAHWLTALALRVLGLMNDDLLQAVPVFIYLGVILQRTTLSAELLVTMAALFGGRAGGLGVASIVLGVLLAPTTGVVGATVLTIGLLTLPRMLAAGYDRRFASGDFCCAGTLGTIIPPSIILIMLSAQMRLAARDVAAPDGGSISVNFLQIFLGAMLPVGVLLLAYLACAVGVALLAPRAARRAGDPVWLAVMFAITIQSGFMMPPSGFAICFLRSVAPAQVKTHEIYQGVAPLLAIQVIVLTLLWTFPTIATWLPRTVYGP